VNPKLRVLYLPLPPHLVHPWLAEVEKALGSQHELQIYDKSESLNLQIGDVDVVIDQGGGNSTHEMADLARGVRLWQILGTGFDQFDLAYWKKKGIPVANTPGQFSSTALAECALMFMLMLAHRWHQGQIDLHRGAFYGTVGEELEGRKLLLLGFGASARALARKACAFGMETSAIEIREVSKAEQCEFGLEYVGKPSDMDRLLSQCDYLSLHLQLNDKTRGIIDGRRLRLMKPGARLINVARGALVDEQALLQVLSEGKLGGAGLDVFASEAITPQSALLKLPNVVATPHIAGATDRTARERAGFVRENIDRVAQGLEPLNKVDVSEVSGASA
jgi:phosphoglycerate dehydrogenase-like enzyme